MRAPAVRNGSGSFELREWKWLAASSILNGEVLLTEKGSLSARTRSRGASAVTTMITFLGIGTRGSKSFEFRGWTLPIWPFAPREREVARQARVVARREWPLARRKWAAL